MKRYFCHKWFLLPLVLIGLMLTACGTPAVSPEPEEAPVEAPVTGDETPIEEPVIIEEPADVEAPATPEPTGDHAVYPGAEFVNTNPWGPQITVYRYISEDSLDDVMAFYQAQYPYLIFDISEGQRVGGIDEEEDAWLETGVINVMINRTDEDYFSRMEFMPSAFMPEDVLAEIPENVTVIEIVTPD